MASFRELIELGNTAIGHLKGGEYASAADKIGDTLQAGFHMVGDLGRQLFGFRGTAPDSDEPTRPQFELWYSAAQVDLAPRALADLDFLRVFTLIKTLVEAVKSLYDLFFPPEPK